MRLNEPVTQKEFILPDDFLLVSKTDLKGTIIYANEAFIEASGYEYGEIIGQPHNILRHPDVPPAVFADFWETIQAGRPWRQIVKNRRKNGDHYWVEANATPIFENGNITGYMSVRSAATKAQVSQAEKAYSAIKAGKLKLHNGEVDTLSKRYNPMAHWHPLVTLMPTTVLALLNEFLPHFGTISEVIRIAIIVMILVSTAHIIYFIRRIDDAINAVDDLTVGKLDSQINVHGANKAGKINRHLKTMQIRLNEQHNNIVHEERLNMRLKSGMSTINAYLMLVDQNGTIVYINNALFRFLEPIEPLIQKTTPDFKLSALTGKNVACLFKNDKEILEACLNIHETKSFNFKFFSAEVQLLMSPIYGDNGQQLGSVIEWQDVFQEMYVQDNIKHLVAQANAGKLHTRVDASELTGFYKDLCLDINHLMDNLQSTLRDISILIGGLPAKNLTLKPEGTHSGQYGWTLKSLSYGIESLRQDFCKVSGLADDVFQSANHVSNSNEELLGAIQAQEAELHKTSRAMRQLTEKVNATTEQAHASNQLAMETQKGVSEGNANMQEAIQAMGEISAVSEQITGIVSLIDNIAFQTNLLALNAAVEAARAGDHGRGFAVVAGEVRSLAQKSADAAREITQLIDTTTDKIQHGTEKVETTGKSLSLIIDQVTHMTDNIAQITANAQEQSQQIKEVNQSIHSLNASAEKSSTLVMENSSLADYLSEVATNMDNLVGTFELGDCNETNQVANQQENAHLVLVVDDNISNQKVALMMLKKWAMQLDPLTMDEKPLRKSSVTNRMPF